MVNAKHPQYARISVLAVIKTAYRHKCRKNAEGFRMAMILL